jgi:hypothetical protein
MDDMSLDNYLTILRLASDTNNPYTDMEDPRAAAALGASFTVFAHGLAAFVNAGRVHLGYTATRKTVMDMVGLLRPVAAPTEDTFDAILLALLQDVDLGPCGECEGCQEDAKEANRDKENEGW